MHISAIVHHPPRHLIAGDRRSVSSFKVIVPLDPIPVEDGCAEVHGPIAEVVRGDAGLVVVGDIVATDDIDPVISRAVRGWATLLAERSRPEFKGSILRGSRADLPADLPADPDVGSIDRGVTGSYGDFIGGTNSLPAKKEVAIAEEGSSDLSPSRSASATPESQVPVICATATGVRRTSARMKRYVAIGIGGTEESERYVRKIDSATLRAGHFGIPLILPASTPPRRS